MGWWLMRKKRRCIKTHPVTEGGGAPLCQLGIGSIRLMPMFLINPYRGLSTSVSGLKLIARFNSMFGCIR